MVASDLTTKQSNSATGTSAIIFHGKPAMMAANAAQPTREVSSSSFYFLVDEILCYLFESRSAIPRDTRKPGNLGTRHPKSDRHAAQGPEAPQVTASIAQANSNLLEQETRSQSIMLVEEVGYNVGFRMLERLMVARPRIWTQRECMKFICKDLWAALFQKQADRLQTNRRGGYVIIDNSLSLLRFLVPLEADHTPSDPSGPVQHPPSSAKPTPEYNATASALEWNPQQPAVYTTLVCGIIRGALTNLGLPCHVVADTVTPPACSFQIKLV